MNKYSFSTGDKGERRLATVLDIYGNGVSGA